jgi:glycosyltransferase involved in cell wall biosynthesis
MKQVLLISPQPFFQWRGSPIRVSFNARALVESGFAVDLLTLPIGEEMAMEGVRVIRVANPFGVTNIPIGPSLHKLIFDVLLFWKGLGLIRGKRYDVIHGIEEAGMIAVLLCRIAGCRAVFEKHSDPFSYKKGFLRNALLHLYAQVEKLTVKGAHAVIGTGPGLVGQVRDMGASTPVFHIFDIPSSLVEPVPENIGRIRKSLVQSDEEVLLTFVGSFAGYQGVSLLFAAIPEVAARCPRARFIIIGGTEKEINEAKRRLEARGAVGVVIFLGKIAPDLLPDYLAASDILLSPRLSGVNTPLKLLDYMKAGRAIVATDVAANRLLLDGRTALLARPAPESLAEAMVELVEDETARKRMGEAGRKLHETRYNFQEFTRRLAACYAALADDNS